MVCVCVKQVSNTQKRIQLFKTIYAPNKNAYIFCNDCQFNPHITENRGEMFVCLFFVYYVLLLMQKAQSPVSL